MRRALACDYPEADIIRTVDEPRKAAWMRECCAQHVRDWLAGGSRVVLLDAAALDALDSVPIEVSLPVARRARLRVYLAPERAGGFAASAGTVGAVDGVFVDADATEWSPTFVPSCVTGRTPPVAMFGPSKLDLQRTYDASDHGQGVQRLERIIAAAVAALSDPLWLRRVVVRSETPTAPRRARKRGDPRAQPYDVLRLAPTPAPHVVRYREPVVVHETPGDDAQRDLSATGDRQRRIARGILLGRPLPEHDVRGHYRRIRTTAGRAIGAGWAFLHEGIRPEDLIADQPVIALVPVKPHTRGKGPRRDVLLKGRR